jgi:hypothetical protein
MTGHVQSASRKFLVPPVAVFTAIRFSVGVQVEAAQSAKYPLHVWKSKTLSGPAARAVSGANTRSTAVRPNTTFENVLPLTDDVCISSSKANALLNFGFLCSRVTQPYRMGRVAQLTDPTSGGASVSGRMAA